MYMYAESGCELPVTISSTPGYFIKADSRDWRILLEKVADSARKAVKLAEPYNLMAGNSSNSAPFLCPHTKSGGEKESSVQELCSLESVCGQACVYRHIARCVFTTIFIKHTKHA